MWRRPGRLAVAIGCCLTGALLADQSQTTIRSRVDAVMVPVAVTDGNRPVRGLTSTDFELLDNKVPQDFNCAVVESLPVDVTLLIDTSGSLQGTALEQFKSDVREIAETLQPNDRVRVVTFGVDATDVSGLQPGGVAPSVDRISAGGATALYNALAAVLAASPHADRPQLIFAFTDGIDNMSFIDAETVVSVARQSTAVLHLALVSKPNGDAHGPALGGLAMAKPTTAAKPNRRLLKEAAAQTGGAVYERAAGTRLAPTFTEALDEFRSSYVLTFTPRRGKAAGWHSLVVRTTNPNYRVRWRRGYDGG